MDTLTDTANTFILVGVGGCEIFIDAVTEEEAWKKVQDAGIRNQSGMLKLGAI